jgi:L-asparaginase
MVTTTHGERPHIRIIGAGGTIASVPKKQGGLAEPVLRSDDVIAGVKELDRWAHVESEDFTHVLSSQLSAEQVFDLGTHLVSLLASRSDLSGIVVTHGTGTMEESAFLADLLVTDPRPVVFTGAMRAGVRSDGSMNLLDAVRVAGTQAARDKGVLIVMNSTIHAARGAFKSHTTALNTFVSTDGGPLGYVYPDRVHFSAASLLRQHIPSFSPVFDVDLVKFAVGMDGRHVEASIAAGAAAIVVEGSGLGNVTYAMADSITHALERGIVVAVCSRTMSGRTYAYYGATSGGGALAERGCILSALSGPQTRILLMLALGVTQNREELQELLDPGGS